MKRHFKINKLYYEDFVNENFRDVIKSREDRCRLGFHSIGKDHRCKWCGSTVVFNNSSNCVLHDKPCRECGETKTFRKCGYESTVGKKKDINTKV